MLKVGGGGKKPGKVLSEGGGGSDPDRLSNEGGGGNIGMLLVSVADFCLVSESREGGGGKLGKAKLDKVGGIGKETCFCRVGSGMLALALAATCDFKSIFSLSSFLIKSYFYLRLFFSVYI